MKKTTRLAAACLMTLFLASEARAHDFWIEPDRFRVGKGGSIALSLRYGMEYVGEVAPRDNRGIESFVVMGPEGTRPVPGQDKQDPAGRVTLAQEGIYLVAYRGKRRKSLLEGAKFEAHLKAEGLEHISKIRAERNETNRGAREFYSRCAKTLLKSGKGAGKGHDRIAGLRLELIPESNPYLAAEGKELTFRVLFDGKPLENGLVVARSRSAPKQVVSARTDSEGRVRLMLENRGPWLIKCTHMIEAPEESGMDWESFWASITLMLGENT